MRTHITLAAVLALVPAARLAGQAPKPQEATIAYLHSLAAPGGGYYPAAPKPGATAAPSLGATNSVLRALKYFGGQLRDKDATARFVVSCFHTESGGFSDTPGRRPSVSSAAIGIMAVIDLGMPQEPYRDAVVKYLSENAESLEDIRIAAAAFEALKVKAPKAEEWLEQINMSRNPDGTFGSGAGAARATGGTVAMILRLGGQIEHREAVLRTMRAGQRPDGGFGTAEATGSDLASSYRIVRAFNMLREPPADPAKLRAFIAKCRNADGGYGVAPGQPSSASGTYYASIILHWLETLAPASTVPAKPNGR